MHTEIEVFRIKKLITLPQLLIRVFIFQVAGYFITVKKNIGYPYIGHVDLNPVEPIWCNRFKSLSLLLFHSVACQQDIGKGEVDSLLSEGLAVFLGLRTKLRLALVLNSLCWIICFSRSLRSSGST